MANHLLPVICSLKVEPKSKGLKQQQQLHKKLLAAMLSQDSFESAPDSPAYIAEEDIEDEDEAMELLGKNCGVTLESERGPMESALDF